MDKSFVVNFKEITETFKEDLEGNLNVLFNEMHDFAIDVEVEEVSSFGMNNSGMKARIFELEAHVVGVNGENQELKEIIRRELGDGYC